MYAIRSYYAIDITHKVLNRKNAAFIGIIKGAGHLFLKLKDP